MDVLVGVHLDFVKLWTLGVQNIAKKKYMKCTLSLVLVEAQHPSELEPPVITGSTPMFSAFSASFLEFL